eukprot:GHRQ01016433.1.p1 GENE.GHRQ01016433.1~~GHRQ01016433.1.p1  ORF type:complete len:408 (+),score=180.53 GHRQ01016433.1:412-1635(+)
MEQPVPEDQQEDSGPPQPPMIAPLSPPEGCLRITEDGGVLKHIITEGSGDAPMLHARCLVHFIGRCLPSGDVFLNSKEDSQAAEPYLVVAGRDTSQRATGLNLAVATMRAGERAAVYITDPAYGYGDKGSFSFPSVPPACQLLYEVDMVTWEPPAEAVDRRTMLYEERLEAAERRRKEGNVLFAAGKHTEALAKYAMALSYCDEDFMLQLQGPHLDKAEEVTNPVYLNMAAAQLKLGDHAAAAHNATQVLVRDPKHIKALFRRGKARAGMGRTVEALEDLGAAAALDPDDREIQRELLALKRLQREEQKATSALFKGSLGPAPKPKPGGGISDMYSLQQEQSAAAGGAAEPQAAAAARHAQGSRHGSSSRGGGLLQPLFALIAMLLGWLQRLLGMLRRPTQVQAARR